MCKKCNNEFDLTDVVEECIAQELSAEAYLAVTDGGNDPFTECPECGKETYVFTEGCCVACDYEQDNKICAVCGTSLNIDEAYEGEICSYHRLSMEKADRD